MTSEDFAKLLVGSTILAAPYVWECLDDDHGDLSKKRDVLWRSIMMILVAGINTALNAKQILIFFLLSINVSIAIFFFLFDYTIAYLLIKNEVVEVTRARWFRYMAKVGEVDNWKFWKTMKSTQRFLIRLGYFILSIAIYVWYVIH